MNSSVNFSTFLHSSDENDQKIKRENSLLTEVNDTEEVDPEKNAMNNITKGQTTTKP